MARQTHTRGGQQTGGEITPKYAETYFKRRDLGVILHRLKDARTLARVAGFPQLLRKIESAIKSAGGAERHLWRVQFEAERGTPIRQRKASKAEYLGGHRR